MKMTLKVWRQPGPDARGEFRTYPANDVSEHMSFLEMLDVVNEDLLSTMARNRSPSITIVGKEFVAPVR